MTARDRDLKRDTARWSSRAASKTSPGEEARRCRQTRGEPDRDGEFADHHRRDRVGECGMSSYSTIPAELRALDHWLVWRYEVRGGRRTKVPYDAEHPQRRAWSTKPATWSSFETTVEAAQASDIDGIGLRLKGPSTSPSTSTVASTSTASPTMLRARSSMNSIATRRSRHREEACGSSCGLCCAASAIALRAPDNTNDGVGYSASR